MRFKAYGHPNITSMHRNTFEFTKEDFVTKTGDCIVGIKADYDVEQIKPILKKDKVKITIKVGDLTEIIHATPYKGFENPKEMVIRRTAFTCKRTFATNADKIALDFKTIREKLKDPEQEIIVEIE